MLDPRRDGKSVFYSLSDDHVRTVVRTATEHIRRFEVKQAFTVEGLCCAKCAAEIEEAVGRIVGCESANMAFMTKKLTIEAPEKDMERIPPRLSA